MDIWGFGEMTEYIRKFSAWVIDFMAHPDDQEWYLSVLKEEVILKYR